MSKRTVLAAGAMSVGCALLYQHRFGNRELFASRVTFLPLPSGRGGTHAGNAIAKPPLLATHGGAAIALTSAPRQQTSISEQSIFSGSGHRSQAIPMPAISEGELMQREYVNARRNQMFEDLERVWEEERESEVSTELERRSVLAQLAHLGDVSEITVHCKQTICRLSIPITNNELGRAAEQLKTPQGIESVLRFIGDATPGAVDRLDIFQLSRERLVDLVGDNPGEALTPASMPGPEPDP